MWAVESTSIKTKLIEVVYAHHETYYVSILQMKWFLLKFLASISWQFVGWQNIAGGILVW